MRAVFVLAIILSLAGCSTKPAGPPDFSGLWMPDVGTLKADGGVMALLPDAAATYARNKAAAVKGDFGFDSWMKCSLHGMPRILSVPSPFRILQTAAKIYAVHEVNHSYRIMPLAKTHGAGEPSYMGDSIARLDGDTLHVETNRLVAGLIDRDGIPHSDALTLTEDYRLSADHQTITGTIRVDDPKTFSAPWSYAIAFHKLPDAELKESICVDMTDAQKKALR